MKNRGLKNWFLGKNRGLKNWILGQFEALELKFCKIWGFGTEIFVNLGKICKKLWFLLKRGLKELKHAEMGVLGYTKNPCFDLSSR